MCYNKMYAHVIPQVGQIAVSRCGHDAERQYVVIAVLNSDFVLCTDGRVRKTDNPKTKRFKHLKVVGISEELTALIKEGKLTDAIIINTLKKF